MVGTAHYPGVSEGAQPCGQRLGEAYRKHNLYLSLVLIQRDCHACFVWHSLFLWTFFLDHTGIKLKHLSAPGLGIPLSPMMWLFFFVPWFEAWARHELIAKALPGFLPFTPPGEPPSPLPFLIN